MINNITEEIAIKIVQQIVKWQFVLSGIVERSEIMDDIDLKEFTLMELIEANNIVKEINSKHPALKKTNESKGKIIRLTVDDRVISGVYFALHYTPGDSIHVLYNDVGVGCVKSNYEYF